jgi:hypothetical protein
MPVPVNTELATGLERGRGSTFVEPEDVAAEIVATLEHPRFDVPVPRSIGRLVHVTGVLPRGAREALGRAFKADKILAEADLGARRDYELRASRSEPGLEAGDDVKQLSRGDGE